MGAADGNHQRWPITWAAAAKPERKAPSTRGEPKASPASTIRPSGATQQGSGWHSVGAA